MSYPSPGVIQAGQRAPADLQDVELTAVRLHGYALRKWFYDRFLLREGVPIPVVYATPMDAFAEFNRLWTTDGGVFDYLKTEEPGVWPVNTRLPIISFVLSDVRYRPDLTASSHVLRRQAWLSTSSLEQGMKLNNVGEVRKVRYAQAWDFNFQVEFWSLRPESQAIFYEQLFDGFRSHSAGEPQTWITVPYPTTHGAQNVRLRLTAGPQNISETGAPNLEGVTLFRTTCTLSIEGYRPDRTTVVVPVLWYATLALNPDNLSPNQLDTLFILNNYDLRGIGQNPIVALRSATMPPPGGSFFGSGTL